MTATIQSLTHNPKANDHSTRRRRFGLAFAVLTVLVILGVTLYPFDFTTVGYRARLDACLKQRFSAADGLADDIFTNILLFLPFGFAFAYLAARRGFNLGRAFLAVLLGGTFLSAFVEFLQLFLPFRYTSFIDIYSNAAGAATGFFIHTLLGKQISRHLAEAVEQPNNRKALRWLSATYLSYFAATLLLTIPLLFSVRMSDWEKSYTLSFGNVHSGNRPWNGVIERLTISKHAINESTIKRSLAERRLSGVANDDLMCNYDFLNGQIESVKKLPRLIVKGNAPSQKSGAELSKQRWYETNGSVDYLSSHLMWTNQFALLIRLKTSSTTQGGPARIISIDKNPYDVNFAVTQLGDQLGIRFRSMTSGLAAYTPGFVIPGVFVDTLPHTVLAINDGLTLRVYVDSKDRVYSTVLGPGLALFNRFLPTRRMLDMTSPMGKLSEMMFTALVFLPLSYVLTFIALGVRRRSSVPFILVSVLGLAIPPLAFNKLFEYMTGKWMTREYFLMTVVMMVAGFVVTLIVQSIKHKGSDRTFRSFVSSPVASTIHQHTN